MIRYKKKLALAKFWKRDYGARQNETSEGKKKVFKMTEGPCGMVVRKGKKRREHSLETLLSSLSNLHGLKIWLFGIQYKFKKKKNLRSKDYYTYSFNIQGLDSFTTDLECN